MIKLENALSSSEKDVKYYQDMCKSKDNIISNLEKSIKDNSNSNGLIDAMIEEGQVECEALDKKLSNATNDIKELNDTLEETKENEIKCTNEKKWKISITNEMFNKEVEEDKIIQMHNGKMNWDEREKQLKEDYVSFLNKINDMEDYLELCNFKCESDNNVDVDEDIIRKSIEEVIQVKDESEICEQIKKIKDEYIKD